VTVARILIWNVAPSYRTSQVRALLGSEPSIAEEFDVI